MHHTANSVHAQQRFIQSQRIESNCLSTFNLLTSDILYDQVEKLLPKHRERLFPPTETLAMFVTQALSADRSCQHVVNQAAVGRLVSGLPTCSTHTGGYCRARQRLPLKMVSELSCYLGRQIDQALPDEWRWKGRRVRLVDGTTVTMPDTPDNQAAYPQPKGQKEGLGFPICRIVGITCLASGALLNAAVGRFNGKGGDEQTLLRSIQETLASGDIIMGDAFFPTFFFIAAMQAQGVDILMEQMGCQVPCDHIPKRSYALFRTRLILNDWLSQQERA
ncbi:IS4 family transposase [Thiolapillus sp.]